MDQGNQIILIGSLLILVSIFAGLVSSRLGAPLLLVFLGLGMLAGEDGLLGLRFDDFQLTYLVGSVALAIILFDGGLRTPRANVRQAGWPALVLATVGVLLTATLTGGFAKWVLGLSWIEGLLIGSIVASTDAAAVFLLLHTRGMRLKERVNATLELESGLNDPMAMFLTIACIELLLAGAPELGREALVTFATDFAVQLVGGLMLGMAGGFLLLALINQLQLFPGLYPVLATTTAILIYALAQTLGASGFLAVFLAGYVLGNRRHRATQLINRFQDGLAWLSQIAMFLLLGLLVTPSSLLPLIYPALAIALVLLLIARPLAVVLCLLPFRFEWREHAFVSWVGLRGAVAIFLGTMPVLAGIEGAMGYFTVAYVVVLTSLVVQGWTVGLAARWTGMELPPRPPAPQRVDIDLPGAAGRDIAGYSVRPASMVLRRTTARLPFPEGASVISIVRDGVVQRPEEIERLTTGDYVLMIAPAERLDQLDRLFASRPPRQGKDAADLGEFVVDGRVPVRAVAEFYDFTVPASEADLPVGAFMARHLRRRPKVGAALRPGEVELVVHSVEDGRITRVGIELDPVRWSRRRLDPLAIRLRAGWRALLRRLRRRRPEAAGVAASDRAEGGADPVGEQRVVGLVEGRRLDQ
jgi:potassium/hydrogen antiporter